MSDQNRTFRIVVAGMMLALAIIALSMNARISDLEAALFAVAQQIVSPSSPDRGR